MARASGFASAPMQIAGVSQPHLPSLPKPPAVRITPVHPKGSVLVEHGTKPRLGSGFNPLRPPKQFVFPNSDKLVKHLAKTTRFPWEGNKTGTPRLRGAAKAHREGQVEMSGYPAGQA